MLTATLGSTLTTGASTVARLDCLAPQCNLLLAALGSSWNLPGRRHKHPHRPSRRASGTTRTSGVTGRKVQAQKAALRSVDLTASPWMLLNHWRSLSTRLTMAMGRWKIEHSCRAQTSGQLALRLCRKAAGCTQTAGHDSHWVSNQARRHCPPGRQAVRSRPNTLMSNHRCMVSCASASHVTLSPYS